MKDWDGVMERRSGMNFCPQHGTLVTDLAVMKNSLINIEKEITGGVSFRRGMITSLVGISIGLVIQIIIFAFLYGGLVNQVGVNTLRLNKLEIAQVK